MWRCRAATRRSRPWRGSSRPSAQTALSPPATRARRRLPFAHLYIITNAAVFSWLLTSEQIPQSMAEWMTAQGFGTVAFLLVTNIVLLAAGNFMDPAAIVLIMAPILFPMAARLGVHPVHLGILMAVNMEVGLCHPPVGLNLYVASGITKMGITELTVAVLPWLGTMLVFLVMVTYIPEISLWLPGVLGMLY
jgi:C4-dicarboxylate transporter DctM subunit